MAAATGSDDITLALPWDIIDAGPGIALDIGGSLVKILYVHKNEYVEPSNRKEESKGLLHLVSFVREELDDAFEHMKKYAYIKRSHPGETVKIYTTGIGGSQFGKRIESALNVTRENVAESECFIHAFNYLLRNVSRIDILQEDDRTLFEQARKKNADMLEIIEKMSKMLSSMDNTDVTKKPDLTYAQESYVARDTPLHEQEGIYPCLLMMMGSGMGGMVIKSDGTCQSGMMVPMGGRMFLGLGSLLTRSKTFAELIELCEKGSAKNVGITNVHLSQGWDPTEESNVYSTMTDIEETMVFFFGQAVAKTPENFRREDLARCLLEFCVKDIVLFTHMTCREKEASTAFFTGGFVNHPLTRKLITKEWLAVDGTMASIQPKDGKKLNKKIGIHFLKHGSHLGALGTYLNSKFHFCDPAAQATTDPSSTHPTEAVNDSQVTTESNAK